MRPVDGLVSSLCLEDAGSAAFVGVVDEARAGRGFGGHLASQALMAAGRTVSGSPPHSLHASFLRPCLPGVATHYQVERTMDGRSFRSRRVVATQGGQVLMSLVASFHLDEPGPEHQHATMPAVAGPESLPPFAERMARHRHRLGAEYDRPRPIDVRFVTPSPFERRPGEGGPPRGLVWMRGDGDLPDDPLLHAAVLTYASDLTLLDTIRSTHGISAWCPPPITLISLNHSVWFYRPFRADMWLLYEQDSPSAHGARALARGSMFTEAGGLVASVVQESLVRPLA